MANFALVKFLFDNTTAVVSTKTIINFNPDKVAKKKFKIEWVEEDGTKSIYKAMVLLTGGGQTIKFMTKVTPAGTISFVSRAHVGRFSDKAISEQSGIIDKLETDRDAVMVDKGFRIDDLIDRIHKAHQTYLP